MQVNKKIHVKNMHIGLPPQVPLPATTRMDKAPRPKVMLVDRYIDEESWEYSENSWKGYKMLLTLGLLERRSQVLVLVDNMVFARVGGGSL